MPGFFREMTQGLPSSRDRSASTARASGPRATTHPPVFASHNKPMTLRRVHVVDGPACGRKRPPEYKLRAGGLSPRPVLRNQDTYRMYSAILAATRSADLLTESRARCA